MPKRNALKDSITIYYAYRLGNVGGIDKYGKIQSVSGVYPSDRSGNAPDDYFGTDRNYSLRLLIPQCESTKYFDLYTKIWVYGTPRSSEDRADYKVTAEPIERDGLMYVRCSSVAVDHRDLYYLYNGEIISFAAIWNEEQNKFYTPTNMYLPIDRKTKLWNIEPDDENSTEGLMSFKSKRSLSRYTEYTCVIENGEI